jgi:Flp pilus assembly protein TadG
LFKKLFLKEDGQSMVLFAIMLIVLVGFAGLAIDGGRLYMAKSKHQKAVDAGALAGADALIDGYLIPNKSVDSSAKNTVKGIANTIATRNYSASYDPSADFVSSRKENYYIVEDTKSVELVLMPVLNIANTTVIKASAKVKITRPRINDLIHCKGEIPWYGKGRRSKL